ncbi:hypothetical protein B0T10DRAFT_562789 [Thelonectria olida]|uniref:Uncharacterized protein n=1 Tax=Thelonectria olida TaxID=1576542 RepID=A0A9P9ARC6_9HYPO|nr:hypothetical protein B0T10DRAFT_562789 [Thelonectria olida]
MPRTPVMHTDGAAIWATGSTWLQHPASNRNYSGRMGSRAGWAHLASPGVVATSAPEGRIAGPGWYRKPEGVGKVTIGEGSGDFVADEARSIYGAFVDIIDEMDSMTAIAETN